MNYYIENLDILSKKHPFLYFLLISKIQTDKKTVDYKYKKYEIKHLDVLFIYKCYGYEILYKNIQKWIANKNKKLYFFDDDLDNLRLFFQTKIANDFLKKENVSFHFFSQIKQLVEQITSTIKTKKVNVITFEKESNNFQLIKREIMQYSLISFLGNYERIYSYKIFKNFYANLEKLKSSYLVNKLENKFKDMPAIVLGAGPSLKYSFEILKKLQNQALFIAGGSAITCLSNKNILPHLAVIIDPNFDEYQRMKESMSFEIPMVYSTRVNFGVFFTFNGPLGYIKNDICGLFEQWIDKILKIDKYKVIHQNDLEKSLTVTTVSLMLARFLGCNPIILEGIDLAYSQNKRYAVDIIDNNESKNENYLSKDKNNKKVYTNLNWEIEKDWISLFAKKNKNIKFINATTDGLIIDNMKQMSLLEIKKKYLKNQFDFKSYIHSLFQESIFDEAKKQDFNSLKLSLKHSFENCKNYFKDIIDDKTEYKSILAKESFYDEIAYKYFLIELDFTLNKFYENSSNYEELKQICEFFIQECKI